MKKLKALCLVLVSVLFLTSFSACESGNTKKEHETITIMNAQRDYRGLVQLVKEKYPEINLEIIPYRGRNQSAYMKQQLEAGVLPDIYSTTQAWDEDLQKQSLLDLTDYDVTGLYNTARIKKYEVDGKLYLLPFDYTVTGICYNLTLFEENDIKVPTNFKELETETIPALKAKGINTSVTLLDLPGTGFNYFFNTNSATYMNTTAGKQWREEFSDVTVNTYAYTSDENLKKCIDYFQRWLDCGMITYEEGVSGSSSKVLEKFKQGNTAFMVGQITSFTQNVDGTGDQYRLLPYFSEEGYENTYVTTPGRLYGLNKELGKKGNEQKLKDALHVLEVLSSVEGYEAINGTSSNNLCSIKDFEPTAGTQYYQDAIKALSLGHSMDLIYVGWDNYIEPFGNAIREWIKGTDGCNAESAFKVLNDTKKTIQENGTPYYATVTEELDTIQAAQLTGQIFMDATNADVALVSYNVYNPNIAPNFENSYGTNGTILKGKQTKEYITIWLATGWDEHIYTVKKTGKVIKEMALQGADTRNTGFYYPYVFMSANGKQLEDDKEYTCVLVGCNRKDRDTAELGRIDTGIVGLEAAMTYLQKVGTISSKTLNNSLVLSK